MITFILTLIFFFFVFCLALGALIGMIQVIRYVKNYDSIYRR